MLAYFDTTIASHLREDSRYVTMSSMTRPESEQGSVLTTVLIVLLAVFLGAAIGFGVWAFTSRQDYKNNVADKVSVAVAANTKTVQAQDAKDYAQAAKQPLKTYVGPEAYGSVHISYPKTWSAYVVTSSSSQPIDAYFNPDYVPGVTQQDSVYALRTQVVSNSYSQVLAGFKGLQQQGKVKVTPYSLPNTPSAVGVRIDGQLTQDTQGSMVVLPMRDKTLKIWTESAKYEPDFNTFILPNASFSP